MDSESQAATNIPLCPRCGYDQSGEVARWKESCPTRGICVECGLDLEWGVLMTPGRGIVPGFVEHEAGWWGAFIAAWRTTGWALVPQRLWSRVRLEAPVRPMRWFLWVFVVLLAFRIGFAAVWAGLQGTSGPCQPPSGPLTTMREFTIAFADSACSPMVRVMGWDEFIMPVTAPPPGTPPARGEPPMLVPPGRGQAWAWMRTARPISVEVIGEGSILEALPFILGGVSIFSIPITLMCLPITRRIARVRKRHVMRAAVYSLSILAVPELLRVISEVERFVRLSGPRPGGSIGEGWIDGIFESAAAYWLGTYLLFLGWLFWYWRGAVRSWRMQGQERPAVLSLGAIVCTLALVVVAYRLTDKWTFWIV
jgi:hypothetical protein